MTNQLDIIFTTLQDGALTTAYTSTTSTNFSFAINLSIDERNSLKASSIDNNRLPYVTRTMDIHVPANPTFVSGFKGTAAQGQTDWTLYKQLDKHIIELKTLLEKFQDTQMLCAHELYEFFLEFYRTAKAAADGNVPGAQAVVDDLAPLFEGQGQQPEPATP